jgi:hypothetical protein
VSLAFVRDRGRKVKLARRGTIEPANGGRWSGPDDIAAAEVMPEGKTKDEQEETEQKNHVEEGKGLENAIASMIDLIRVALHIGINDDAILFRPALYLGIGDGRIGGDCTKSEPEDGEDAKP